MLDRIGIIVRISYKTFVLLSTFIANPKSYRSIFNRSAVIREPQGASGIATEHLISALRRWTCLLRYTPIYVLQDASNPSVIREDRITHSSIIHKLVIRSWYSAVSLFPYPHQSWRQWETKSGLKKSRSPIKLHQARKIEFINPFNALIKA